MVRNGDSGFYEYASVSADGVSLTPSGTAAGSADPATLGIAAHTRPSRAGVAAREAAARVDSGPRRWEVRRQERKASDRERAAAAPGATEAAPPQPTATGTIVGLCLLAQFPDVPATITRLQVDNFCNLPGYTEFGNNGSVQDYFESVSDGKLHYRNRVVEYFTTAHDRSYYTEETIAYGTRAQELIKEGLDHLAATGYDFTQLSSDGSGFVYALNVFYAGPTVNAWAKGLWPHSSSLSNTYQAAPGKKLSDYQITDIGSSLTLRTFCHENGHMVCDYPDLYDYGYESTGVGNYCLMCFGGSDLNPVEVCAYLKNQAGWTSSMTTLSNGAVATVTSGTNNFLLRSKSATEYFILENRQRTGRDASLPDDGLFIWHVDELGSNSNEQMTAAQHYELSLEQADGHFDLEHGANYGDATDLFGAPTAVTFGNATSPNSLWWDGSDSGLEIQSVSATGPSMTVRLKGALSLVVNNFGYTAGGWRVDRHPRFVTDVTGDGCADIIGFGDAGVWVSRNNGNGTFQSPVKVVDNFAYDAGGWRVEKHPRLLADLTGDGTADIIGFGSAGVWVSLNNGNGTFAAPVKVVDNFAYDAGGWRVENHPRFLADLTGDGRADIVGFGSAGVWVSLNNGNGTFAAPTLAVTDFGYDAGGWRVEKHPRFLADLTGDGRADIIGFGSAGVWVSLNNGNGTFAAPVKVVDNFAYDAGGWRVEKHPRLLADLTGDGRADIIGFGDAGVWVSLNNGNGTFAGLSRVIDNYAYSAGGWRVDQHPRFLADLNKDGRADVVGFGDAGVWASINNGNGTF